MRPQQVIDSWQYTAPDGFKRCRFQLERTPGQPAIPAGLDVRERACMHAAGQAGGAAGVVQLAAPLACLCTMGQCMLSWPLSMWETEHCGGACLQMLSNLAGKVSILGVRAPCR